MSQRLAIAESGLDGRFAVWLSEPGPYLVVFTGFPEPPEEEGSHDMMRDPRQRWFGETIVDGVDSFVVIRLSIDPMDGTLRVSLRDEVGAPCGDVRVYIDPWGANGALSADADHRGDAVFKGLRAAPHRVTIGADHDRALLGARIDGLVPNRDLDVVLRRGRRLLVRPVSVLPSDERVHVGLEGASEGPEYLETDYGKRVDLGGALGVAFGFVVHPERRMASFSIHRGGSTWSETVDIQPGVEDAVVAVEMQVDR